MMTRSDALDVRTLEVDGRRARAVIRGRGVPVVFLHGWSLGPRSYQDALDELVARGCRVYAPALPGFGGTANLPASDRTVEGYAAWVGAFLDTVGVDEPAVVAGHSFGGGVAIRVAHDAPERVEHLVLINSVGTPTGSTGPALAAQPYDRPVWDYGLHLARELFWSRDGCRIMRAIREDVVRNLVGNPVVLLEIGLLARQVDLTTELADLRDREVPILVLWSDGDDVLPLASFDALCAAIGTEGRVLPGGHSWLLANPRALTEVLDNLVQVQVADHESSGASTTASELRSLLSVTNIPDRTVTRLLTAASPLWLMSERPSVLAADLAMCHPRLAGAEVRAVARPLEDLASYRVTVVAADRPGLLADTAAALAEAGLTVLSASVATWTDSDLALHTLTCRSRSTLDPDWDDLGSRLRSMADHPPAGIAYRTRGRATVRVTNRGPGQILATVEAPDAPGLLHEVCRWFAGQGLNIEAAEITTRDTVATDRFLVSGEFDASALAAHLSPRQSRPWPRRLVASYWW